MLKLYHSAQSRSTRPRWLLEEIGAPYDLVRVDMGKQEHKTPQYLQIHPHGVVPALVDGDLVLMESGAICAYLADKFPAPRLAPAVGTPERGRYYQWMFYTMATLEPPLMQVFMNTVMLPEAQRSAAQAEEGRTKFREVAEVITNALAGKPFLLGEQFSAADVMIGSTIVWAQMLGLLAEWPALAEYGQRLSSRPALQRAFAD
jgi:glutathione S-transferase